MRSVVLLWAVLFAQSAIGSGWPAEISSSEQELADLREAATAVLSDSTQLGEMRAYENRTWDTVDAHGYSSPYGIEKSSFLADIISCSRTETTKWSCGNEVAQVHMYMDSVEKSLWVADGIAREAALKILNNAAEVCDLDFGGPYWERPRLSYKADLGYFLFNARRCRLKYRILDGQLRREKTYLDRARDSTPRSA